MTDIKTLEFLEYLKIELIQILPQIEEASRTANDQHIEDQKKLGKARKKLKKVIDNTKEDLIENRPDLFFGVVPDNYKELNSLFKKQSKNNKDIKKSFKMIEEAIEHALILSEPQKQIIV